MLKTYIITVEESPRISWMESQLQQFRHFLDWEFVIQPPGYEINLLELAVNGMIKLFPMHKVSEKLFDIQTFGYRAGTLGCMLGHYQASRKILDNLDEHALVLEDNAELLPYFEESVRCALTALEGQKFDILHLFSTRAHSRRNLRDHVYFGEGEWGTSKAQIVSYAFARFVCSNLPFHDVSDGITMLPSLKWIPTGLESFAVFPYPVAISTQFKSVRRAIDSAAGQPSVVFKQIRGTTCAHIVGFRDAEATWFEIDGKMHAITFGLCKIAAENDGYRLLSVLTANEIRELKPVLSLEGMTPSHFLSAGDTVAIACDNDSKIGLRILSKKGLLARYDDGSYLAPYIREVTIPSIPAEIPHHGATLEFLYESLYSPFRY